MHAHVGESNFQFDHAMFNCHFLLFFSCSTNTQMHTKAIARNVCHVRAFDKFDKKKNESHAIRKKSRSWTIGAQCSLCTCTKQTPFKKTNKLKQENERKGDDPLELERLVYICLFFCLSSSTGKAKAAPSLPKDFRYYPSHSTLSFCLSSPPSPRWM